MKTIYRYPLEHLVYIEDDDGLLTRVIVPGGRDARVLFVGTKDPGDELPTLWIEVDTEAPRKSREFHIVGTGHYVPNNLQYLGTAVCAHGTYVWHIFERSRL